MIRIAGLRALSDRLAHLDMTQTQQAALDQAARMLQETIQNSLSTAPGGDHTTPWRQTGTLQSSIGYRSDATSAAIGSDDTVAVDQELGTRNIPPRPFLSTAAAAHAEEIATQVARSVAIAIRDAAHGSAP